MNLFSLFQIQKVFAQSPEELVGSIKVPEGVQAINKSSGVGSGIGIIFFMSNMIRLILIIAAIWALLNLFIAAFTYITGGGKSDSHTKVKNSVSMSVIGLVLIVASYSVAALLGLIFYGDPSYILTPTIEPL